MRLARTHFALPRLTPTPPRPLQARRGGGGGAGRGELVNRAWQGDTCRPAGLGWVTEFEGRQRHNFLQHTQQTITMVRTHTFPAPRAHAVTRFHARPLPVPVFLFFCPVGGRSLRNRNAPDGGNKSSPIACRAAHTYTPCTPCRGCVYGVALCCRGADFLGQRARKFWRAQQKLQRGAARMHLHAWLCPAHTLAQPRSRAPASGWHNLASPCSRPSKHTPHPSAPLPPHPPGPRPDHNRQAVRARDRRKVVLQARPRL